MNFVFAVFFVCVRSIFKNILLVAIQMIFPLSILLKRALIVLSFAWSCRTIVICLLSSHSKLLHWNGECNGIDSFDIYHVRFILFFVAYVLNFAKQFFIAFMLIWWMTWKWKVFVIYTTAACDNLTQYLEICTMSLLFFFFFLLLRACSVFQGSDINSFPHMQHGIYGISA